jgi:hypothetical protein
MADEQQDNSMHGPFGFTHDAICQTAHMVMDILKNMRTAKLQNSTILMAL